MKISINTMQKLSKIKNSVYDAIRIILQYNRYTKRFIRDLMKN